MSGRVLVKERERSSHLNVHSSMILLTYDLELVLKLGMA